MRRLTHSANNFIFPIPVFSLESGSIHPAQLKKEFVSERRKTGWGYGDVDSDPVSPYLGLPQLENKNNWREPKGK
ncbi:MAG: hypothetical protein LBN41_08355 [Enterobacteriaceae bacterium]|nr:hypothetical protein [Enterobacteriaceae bacterium]